MAKDSLANAAGSPMKITLKDKEFLASPLTIGDLADFESSLKAGRLSQFLGIADQVTSEERTKIITDLCSSGIDMEEVVGQMNTLTGATFLLWKSLNRNNKELTLEQVSRLVDMGNLTEVAAIVQSLGGGEDNESPPAPASEESP